MPRRFTDDGRPVPYIAAWTVVHRLAVEVRGLTHVDPAELRAAEVARR